MKSRRLHAALPPAVLVLSSALCGVFLSPAVTDAAPDNESKALDAHHAATEGNRGGGVDPSGTPSPKGKDDGAAADGSPTASTSEGKELAASSRDSKLAGESSGAAGGAASTTSHASTTTGKPLTAHQGKEPSSPVPYDLPTGADKTGVSSQSISVPQGAGKIEGMGESFSAQLSTGIGTFSVPFSLPQARGAASPSLALSYSSSAGHGVAGVGWDVGVPFIQRQTDRRLPTYADPPNGGPWYPEQDRFAFNGGQELVPICHLGGGGSPTCDAPGSALPGEIFPSWTAGFQYFRSRVEGSFLRFFWSPDHKTWRVEDKSGVVMELGVPLDGSNYLGGLERNPTNSAQIFRWDLARQIDTNDNPVVYRYRNDGAMAYLSDIYDTPPVAGGGTSSYAHHTRLGYETRPDSTTSYRRGWQTTQALRLAGVDVASASASGAGARKVVRRYHLAYEDASTSHVSLLKSVELEGRCVSAGGSGDPEDAVTPVEGADESLPASSCPSLPPMTFDYSHVVPYDLDGSAGTADLKGYEGFDERVRSMVASPGYSIDDTKTGLFDINADALPDVLVTATSDFGGAQGVFFNGGTGVLDTFQACKISVHGVNGDTINVVSLLNANVTPLDVDGDGLIDLLHMPPAPVYAVYSPTNAKPGSGCGSWSWQGRTITNAQNLNPEVNFTTDATNVRTLDVNGDGLVDLVRSTGTSYQTFFSLGRYPGGDGQFGHATWTGPTTAQISGTPVSACVPYDGAPVQLGDPDVRLGDMNGDGLPDIVRVRQGDIRYWPGRANGVWGTGDASTCVAGTFGQANDVVMATSPWFSDPEGTGLRLDDVNGDGLDDLVDLELDTVHIWLNVDGAGWTSSPHTIQGSPANPKLYNRVQLTDMNGSGTRDIVWGDGGSGYKYIDLSGGERPWILNHVANGLGKTTDITYASSTTLLLAAQASGHPWSSWTPMPVHVVTQVTEQDNLPVGGNAGGVYVTTYEYRDPVYDGRQREFRGFHDVKAKRVGDSNSPSSTSESTFLLGICQHDDPSSEDPCTHATTWRDNPREALKGLPVVTETFDDHGVYLSSAHHTYALRRLYHGLDGRDVRHAFESDSDTFLYDTAAFVAATGKLATPDVRLDLAPATSVATPDTAAATLTPDTDQGTETGWIDRLDALPKRATTGTAHLVVHKVVDVFGNLSEVIDKGCTEGCVGPDPTVTPWTDETLESHTVPTLVGDWMWRTSSSWRQGSAHGSTKWQETDVAYDAHGQPISTSVVFEGGLSETLKRFHASSLSLAPTPSNVTAYGSSPVVVSETEYDGFGHPISQAGAGGRCRTVSYDTTFGQLVTEETTYAGAPDGSGACGGLSASKGAIALQASADYDRGLAAPVAVHDLHGELTKVVYDGFGRLAELFRPDPSSLGDASADPSVVVSYLLTTNATSQPYSLLHTQTQTGADPMGSLATALRDTWAYVDGLGRTVLTLEQGDTDHGDPQPWIVHGLTEYDAKGAARRAYRGWYYGGEPDQYPLSQPPLAPFGSQRYDAFGRQVQTYNLDSSVTLQSAYHAVSKDLHDAADLAPGLHQGTYASARTDGHGRAIATTERAHVSGGGIELREVQTQFVPTGAPEVITRARLGSSDKIVRWMHYDTQGRLLFNMDPSTSPDFTATPGDDSGLRAWRYAYSDAGDLVGTSDARGCGVNYAYDAAGRIRAEDYSPCTDDHPLYTSPSSDLTTGAEVVYVYDNADAAVVGSGGSGGSGGGGGSGGSGGSSGSTSSTSGCIQMGDPSASGAGNLTAGRLTGIRDRGAYTVMTYDGRGRSICSARRMARPSVDAAGGTPEEAADRYTDHWFHAGTTYDEADRPVDDATGAESSAFAPGGASIVTTHYTQRGDVASVDSTYGTLVSSITRDADGLVLSTTYGDAAGTTTAYGYDSRKRLHSVQTFRSTPSVWTSPPSGYSGPTGSPTSFQLLLEDLDYDYDVVDNPTLITDYRNGAEWPDGAKPVSRAMQYDDLYRLTRLDFQYKAGTDTWTSPFAPEDNGTATVPLATPSPHVSFANRVEHQTFAYDWLGNTGSTGDDANGFYDRSLGAVTNGGSASPYQLSGATNITTGSSPTNGGSLRAAYDGAGNLTGMTLFRAGTCLPSSATCSQQFRYTWDEVGRLIRARRWDTPPIAGPPSAGDLPAVPSGDVSGSPDVDLRYAYDAHDDRVRKTAVDGGGDALHTVYVFDSLTLRRADCPIASGHTVCDNYEDTASTEAVSLAANGVGLARLAYDEAAPTVSGTGVHVLLELGDHLGSTSLVIDQATGELVEAGTYLAYGQTETDYRPGRWDGFREDERFTGKEEDVEVGLTYFGARYLSSYLGRWASADPLAVHAAGSADLNVYAYVHGSLLSATDPVGLATPGSDVEKAADAIQAKTEADQAGGSFAAPDGLAVDGDGNIVSTEAAKKFIGPPKNFEDSVLVDTGESTTKAADRGHAAGVKNGSLDALSSALSTPLKLTLLPPAVAQGYAIDRGFDALKADVPSGTPLTIQQVHEQAGYQVGYQQAAIGGSLSLAPLAMAGGLEAGPSGNLSIAERFEATESSVATKVSSYLLDMSHPVGGAKAAWFDRALGFNQSNAEQLTSQISFDASTAVKTETNQYGTKFNQVIPITGANEKTIDVTFAWIRNNDGIIRLVTGIPSAR